MNNIVFVLWESGKFSGAFTEKGLDEYLIGIYPKIEWGEWKFDINNPYIKILEGITSRNIPTIRIAKCLIDGFVF